MTTNLIQCPACGKQISCPGCAHPVRARDPSHNPRHPFHTRDVWTWIFWILFCLAFIALIVVSVIQGSPWADLTTAT